MTNTVSSDPVPGKTGPDGTASDAAAAPSLAPAAPKATGAALLVSLLALAGVSGFSYWGWSQQQALHQALDQAQQQLTAQARQLAAQEPRLGELQAALAQVSDQSPWQRQFDGMDQRLSGVARRLQTLETTNREDWLLAEAEYLVRLASQRLLMERSSSGALVLVEAADDILKNLDRDDLFSVRQQLTRDITRLKLVPAVDRSGLYMQLAALTEQVEDLSDLPGNMQVAGEPVPVADAQLAATEAQAEGIWQQLQAHFWDAAATVGRYIRVRHHDQTIVPILPPDSSVYLRQNIRLMVERAQLALLREDTTVFQHSLGDAAALIRKYFATQDQAQRLVLEFERLAQAEIQQTLPDLHGSVVAVQEYVTRQRQLAAPAAQADAL